MGTHKIVCTEQEPFYQPTTHAHIVAVGIGTDPAKAQTRLTLEQVIAAMDRGETFYTVSPSTAKIALVEKFHCASCRKTHIRSKADAVIDNNLDNLRRCNWQS